MKLHYERLISDGNELGLFEITNETGEIHLRRIPRSDEFGKGYTLTVFAKNLTSGDTATTSVYHTITRSFCRVFMIKILGSIIFRRPELHSTKYIRSTISASLR